MTNQPPEPERSRTAEGMVEFRMGDRVYRMGVAVPADPVPRAAVLSLFRGLMELSIEQGVQKAAREGRAVSCRAGCGACCRQLVPVSTIEARVIRDMVMKLPEERRSAVLERFAEARQRLEEAGLLGALLGPEELAVEERRELGWNYFQLGLPCPFLVDESCSIHADRPIICREYLVTTPAENCGHPTKETIRRVDLPLELSPALGRFRDGEPNEPTWVALAVALEWAESHPETEPDRPGPEWVSLLLSMVGRGSGRRAAGPSMGSVEAVGEGAGGRQAPGDTTS